MEPGGADCEMILRKSRIDPGSLEHRLARIGREHLFFYRSFAFDPLLGIYMALLGICRA